jgi:formylglycine-generating enzyme required for sulfatase activity
MWCSEQLGKLQASLASNGWNDVQVLAVSTDPHRDSRKMIQGVKEVYGLTIDFPLLADRDHRVIDRYGLLNMKTSPGPATRRYANPGTFILDRNGTVRWRMVDENWKLRPTSELIAAAVERVRRGEDATALTLASFFGPDEVAHAAVDPAAPAGSTEGMTLVPGGTVRQGVKGRFSGDAPERRVQVDAFYMDTYEVTNTQYAAFLAAVREEGHRRCHPAEPANKDHTPAYWTDSRYNGERHPVVGVDWFDAFAYTAWAGKQLPTEAQWEMVARSARDVADYPWGVSDENDYQRANFDPYSGEGVAALEDQGKPRPFPAPSGPKPVGSYPAFMGIHDIIGNVEEWCFDWYDPDYYRHGSSANPTGPARGSLKVVRGGSWHHAKGRAHTRYTHPPGERAPYLGFRGVRPAAAADTTAAREQAPTPRPGVRGGN